MSKLARVLAVGALLTAMSLASTAHAQDDAQSQQAGITQSAPPQPEPPDTPEGPGTPQGPGAPEGPGTTPSSTTTTHPPVVRPKALPVTVSPQAGRPGTTVTVRADLRGCMRPDSAHGFFQEVHEWGTDGLSRWLVWERVDGGRWYTGQYLVTKQEPVGLGRFGVVCDNAIDGFATFRVQPSNPHLPVRVTPQAGGPGTTVRITADLPQCDKFQIDRYDSKGRKFNHAVKGIVWDGSPGRITDRYTITSNDPVGPMRFKVTCYVSHKPVYDGSASFRVHASNSGGGSGGHDHNANRNDSQFPNRIDTGLGGTADGTSQGGLDPVWLLPAAGLLLIALAVGLWRRQTTVRRQR